MPVALSMPVSQSVQYSTISTRSIFTYPLAVAEVWLMSVDLDRLVSIQIVAVNMFEDMCDSVVAILSDFLSRWTVENEMAGEDQQVEWGKFGWFDLLSYLFI